MYFFTSTHFTMRLYFNPSLFISEFSSYVYDIPISFHIATLSPLLETEKFFVILFLLSGIFILFDDLFLYSRVSFLTETNWIDYKEEEKPAGTTPNQVTWITAIFARTTWHLIDRRYCFLLHITQKLRQRRRRQRNDIVSVPFAWYVWWMKRHQKTNQKWWQQQQSFTTYLFCTIKRFHGLMHCQEMNMRVLCPVSYSCSFSKWQHLFIQVNIHFFFLMLRMSSFFYFSAPLLHILGVIKKYSRERIAWEMSSQ